MEFARLEKMIGEEKMEILKNKTILILGVGGVGGYVAEALARSGIGKLILVDFDAIELTNINRQVIALHSTIGRKKVEVFKERIQDIHPLCEVLTYDLFYQEENKNILFENEIDYVVDACDTIESKKLIIKECLKRKIPFISSMGTGNKFDPSKLYITDIRKTINDPLARILRKWVKEERIKEKITVLSSSELPIKTKDRTPGSTAFVPPSAGLLIASKVVCDLIEEKEAVR